MRLADVAAKVSSEPGMADLMWSCVGAGAACAVLALLAAWFGVKDKALRSLICARVLLLVSPGFLMFFAWRAYFLAAGGDDWRWMMLWALLPCALSMAALAGLGIWAIAGWAKGLSKGKPLLK